MLFFHIKVIWHQRLLYTNIDISFYKPKYIIYTPWIIIFIIITYNPFKNVNDIQNKTDALGFAWEIKELLFWNKLLTTRSRVKDLNDYLKTQANPAPLRPLTPSPLDTIAHSYNNNKLDHRAYRGVSRG